MRRRRRRCSPAATASPGRSPRCPARSGSREVGLNERELKHGFRTIVGCTIHDGLTGARLDAAAHMLANGASVTETARAVGYNNLSHLAKAFRRRHGATPRSWRGAGHGGITPELARIPLPVPGD